mgnify:CR=1 FL=1
MKKLGKILMWTGVVLLALAALLIVHPLWIGGAVRGVANLVTPKITGVDFKLGEFALNAYGGRLHVGDVKLWNPTNYADEIAFSLGSLDVAVDMSTVTSNVIVITDVTIDGVYATYVKEEGKYNFDVIAENAAGGSEQPVADSTAKTQPQSQANAAKAPVAEEPSQVKVIIDRLTIRNVKAKYRLLPIVVPMEIVLEDIGKESGGATWTEVGLEILNAVIKASGDLGEGLVSVGGSALDLGNDGLTNALNAVKALDLKGAGDSLKNARDGIKNLFKQQK